MKVPVKLFARARDLAGTPQCELTIAQGATLGELKRVLLQQFPALQPLGPQLLGAINADYASDATPLPPNAEVAFFPPVSGG